MDTFSGNNPAFHYSDLAVENKWENAVGIFSGRIANRENIGKTSEKLVAKWNEEFPDDQVLFSEN